MTRGKAPGSDGFPVEFYLKFWEVLGEIWLRSLIAVLIGVSLLRVRDEA